MAESVRRQRIREALSHQGYLVVGYPAGPYARKGTADLLVCAMGRFIALEVKDDGGVLGPAQIAFGERVKRAGGQYVVAHNVPEAIEGVERALATPPDLSRWIHD